MRNLDEFKAKQLIRNLKREHELKAIEAIQTIEYIRPDILNFAFAMENVMREHDEKKGDSYKSCSIAFLVDKVDEEYNEFFDATFKMNSNGPLTENVIKEIIDLGNCAMMLWSRKE